MVLSLTQLLDLSPTAHPCLSLTWTDIKTEIWISFSIFIRSSSVFLQKHTTTEKNVLLCIFFLEVPVV